MCWGRSQARRGTRSAGEADVEDEVQGVAGRVQVSLGLAQLGKEVVGGGVGPGDAEVGDALVSAEVLRRQVQTVVEQTDRCLHNRL